MWPGFDSGGVGLLFVLSYNLVSVSDTIHYLRDLKVNHQTHFKVLACILLTVKESGFYRAATLFSQSVVRNHSTENTREAAQG